MNLETGTVLFIIGAISYSLGVFLYALHTLYEAI